MLPNANVAILAGPLPGTGMHSSLFYILEFSFEQMGLQKKIVK